MRPDCPAFCFPLTMIWRGFCALFVAAIVFVLLSVAVVALWPAYDGAGIGLSLFALAPIVWFTKERA